MLKMFQSMADTVIKNQGNTYKNTSTGQSFKARPKDQCNDRLLLETLMTSQISQGDVIESEGINFLVSQTKKNVDLNTLLVDSFECQFAKVSRQPQEPKDSFGMLIMSIAKVADSIPVIMTSEKLAITSPTADVRQGDIISLSDGGTFLVQAIPHQSKIDLPKLILVKQEASAI